MAQATPAATLALQIEPVWDTLTRLNYYRLS
jgi:hypothetical protein